MTSLELVIGHSRRPPGPLAEVDHDRARRVRDILHARFAEPIGLPELAKEVGVSTFHLPRIFKREFGLPPHAYQNHLRIAEARRLLRKGLAPSQVAQEVGFCDQSHLNRQFKRTLGFTPAAFRAPTP
ncbi:MAG: helix-turn-helix domain-containing protein [Polyangia bacterium]